VIQKAIIDSFHVGVNAIRASRAGFELGLEIVNLSSHCRD